MASYAPVTPHYYRQAATTDAGRRRLWTLVAVLVVVVLIGAAVYWGIWYARKRRDDELAARAAAARAKIVAEVSQRAEKAAVRRRANKAERRATAGGARLASATAGQLERSLAAFDDAALSLDDEGCSDSDALGGSSANEQLTLSNLLPNSWRTINKQNPADYENADQVDVGFARFAPTRVGFQKFLRGQSSMRYGIDDRVINPSKRTDSLNRALPAKPLSTAAQPFYDVGQRQDLIFDAIGYVQDPLANCGSYA